MNCVQATTCVIADGLGQTSEQLCPGCNHLIALVIAPGNGIDPNTIDYHWHRLDSNGLWSHKHGKFPVSGVDESGNAIANPETADRKLVTPQPGGPDFVLDYNVFCGYFCVDKNIVAIG